MRRIVAIGGGDIKLETTRKIDEYVINLTGKKNPLTVFLPTASGDNLNYQETFKAYYESLGSNVLSINLREIDDKDKIREMMLSSDIIYIGGGNTERMLRIFKRYGVKDILLEAYNKGIILTGLSAGCACYFKGCLSDCNRSTGLENPLRYLECLGYVNYINTPHYNEPERKNFDKFILDYDIPGIAVSDDNAVVFENEELIGIKKSNDKFDSYIFINGEKRIIQEM